MEAEVHEWRGISGGDYIEESEFSGLS
ncbi:hypothetical protein CCACVL1_22260 [Corchorus capsularis]|uniref:Uncharacterized protein n=1 Tax=Corchorus capsularis TaxID=210143 RepID=A0A1R3H0E1_COCAP|nr:hypothetical protein CCACVL1_22260 [Corchorus capsularis]